MQDTTTQPAQEQPTSTGELIFFSEKAGVLLTAIYAEYQGKPYACINSLYADTAKGCYQPVDQGVRLYTDMLLELKQAVDALCAKAGLMPPESSTKEEKGITKYYQG